MSPEQVPSAPSVKPVIIHQSDIHLLIKQLTGCYIPHFRSVQFLSLCKAANVTKVMLPTITSNISNGHNRVCDFYLLGDCQGKICGHMPEGHIPVTDIMNHFAQELHWLLAPGITK